MSMELIEKRKAIRIAEQGQIKGFEWQFTQLAKEPTVKVIPIEVVEQIRAEIETRYCHCDLCEYVEDYDWDENAISEYQPIGDIAEILAIIDKAIKEVSNEQTNI